MHRDFRMKPILALKRNRLEFARVVERFRTIYVELGGCGTWYSTRTRDNSPLRHEMRS